MSIEVRIAIRYKDDLQNADSTTVGEHNKIVQKNGKVWLGKFGLPVSVAILRLCGQPNVRVKLILIRARSGQKDTASRIFIADLSSSQNKRPKSNLVPTYYRKRSDIIAWFCLTSQIIPMTRRETKSWVIASSALPLLAAIRKCPRTFFAVTKKAHLQELKSLLARFAKAGMASHQARSAARIGAVKVKAIADFDYDAGSDESLLGETF